MADPTSSSSRPVAATTLVSSVLAVLLGTVGIVALGVVLAADDDDDGAIATGGAPGGSSSMPSVGLTEFAIDPAALTVAAGGMLHVTNSGTIEHNLAVADQDLRTENLAAGASGELPVADLAPGEYELLCELPGHADSGMTATLTVTAGGESAGGATDTTAAPEQMDYQAMTDAMLASFAAYPASTEGLGNQPLEPTEVLADGTKVFDLTMQLGDWEVDPGNVVEAWTFNGMVPAPLIRLQIGDRMQLRVQNDLPIATDVHLHGLNVENRFDGVAPLTQDLIEPGASFTYEYVADEQAVAMYHPHAHGHMLLPNGMFGGIIVGDIALPRGQTVAGAQIPADLQVSQEIPMVLNDSGVIGYSLNGKSFPATQPYTAVTGDWVLIHYFNEGNQIHPMHLHQFDQIVVARDGFPVDAPYTVDTLSVAPGERYSVLVHLDRPGAWVWHCHILNHVEREEGMFGMVTAFLVE